MRKRPSGFGDLIPPEIRKELEAASSEPADTDTDIVWNDAVKALKQGLSIDRAINDAKEGTEAAYDYLLGIFGKYVAEDIPDDARQLRTNKPLRDRLNIEYYLLEILDYQAVREALYPDSGKEADKSETVDRRVGYALNVARILGFSDTGKDAARKQVANKHGVSFSTVRDSYDKYGEFARSVYLSEGAIYK